MSVHLRSSLGLFLWIWSLSYKSLHQLRMILRERNGRLHWTGKWSQIDPAWRLYSREDCWRIAKKVLLSTNESTLIGSLPSEMIKWDALERLIRKWHETVSMWQIVTLGEPCWTSEEAAIWKRDLDRIVGRWLWRYIRISSFMETLIEWFKYTKRRLAFLIHTS